MGAGRDRKTETTQFVWDGMNLAYESTGEADRKYSYDVTGIHAGSYGLYLKNPHGDVVSAYSKTLYGEPFSYDYDAFGNQTQSAAEDTNPFRYCGEYYDADIDLIYLRARYYDPSIGRFITEDPIKDGLNWYAYANNNPIMFVDPNGETAAFILGCTIVGAAGNVAAQVAVNWTTGADLHDGVLTAMVAGAVSGLVFGATLNTAASVAAGTLVTMTIHAAQGEYSGENGMGVFCEDLANGVLSYAANRVAGVFIKTNNGWFQPRGLKSFFTKSYGQKIIKQTIAAGAVTSATVSMYENGKRNIRAIQEFLGITVDGNYGSETRKAVQEFQEYLVDTGYLENSEDATDGWWGEKTDAAFTWYIRQNVTFLAE